MLAFISSVFTSAPLSISSSMLFYYAPDITYAFVLYFISFLFSVSIWMFSTVLFCWPNPFLQLCSNYGKPICWVLNFSYCVFSSKCLIWFFPSKILHLAVYFLNILILVILKFISNIYGHIYFSRSSFLVYVAILDKMPDIF